MRKIANHNIKWILLGGIFLFPFVGVECFLKFGWEWGKLIDFGLSTKDFFTLWITMFGVIGLIINIVINSNRLSTQERELNLQFKSVRDERFSRAIELLSSKNTFSRIGGANLLYSLAKEYKDEYREVVFNILCTHLKTVTKRKQYIRENKKEPSNEVLSIIELLFRNNEFEENLTISRKLG